MGITNKWINQTKENLVAGDRPGNSISTGTKTTTNPTENFDKVNTGYNMTENFDKVNTGYNMTENFDKVNTGYNAPTWNGGTGVGSKSNIEMLAEDYINSNYDSFTKGADYASLAKRYSDQGRQAMDDTIGQVAARTGGLASSYAGSAAQQAYGSWMEKLEDAARSLYDSQMAEKANKLGVAQGLYDRAYSEYIDDRDFGWQEYSRGLDDAKWKDSMGWQEYSRGLDDAQWKDSMGWQEYSRGLDDAQWKDTMGWQEYSRGLDDAQWKDSKINEQNRYEEERTRSDAAEALDDYTTDVLYDLTLADDIKSMTFEEYKRTHPAPEGFDERDFEMLKKQVQQERLAQYNSALEKGEADLTEDEVNNAIEAGEIDKDVLRNYKIYNGVGYFEKDILKNFLSGANVDEYSELLGRWYEIDPEGFWDFLTEFESYAGENNDISIWIKSKNPELYPEIASEYQNSVNDPTGIKGDEHSGRDTTAIDHFEYAADGLANLYDEYYPEEDRGFIGAVGGAVLDGVAAGTHAAADYYDDEVRPGLNDLGNSIESEAKKMEEELKNGWNYLTSWW